MNEDQAPDIGTLFDAIANQQWWAAVAVGITFVVWLVRRIAKRWDVLQTRRAGWALNIVTSLLVALVPYFTTLEAFSWPDFGKAVLTALKLLATSGILWHGLLDAGVAKSPASKALAR